MPFVVGEAYTRDQIYAEFKGEKQSFLPQHDGRIVCGCFRTDFNPDAPRVVLVSSSEDDGNVLKKAKLLVAQGGTIPVFLKSAHNEWTYRGIFRLAGHSENLRELIDLGKTAGLDNVRMALYFELAYYTGDAYLLTWNPEHWDWTDREEMARQTAEGSRVEARWSCGNTKRIKPGDRLFLLRQGVDPRGIVGAGWATSSPYEDLHWDAARRERGESALRVNLSFERVLNVDFDDPLPIAALRNGLLPTVYWSTPASGIQIKVGIETLERLWADHIQILYAGPEETGQAAAAEGGVRMALRRHRARERWLRDAKLEEAKRKHQGRLPCEACRFDFLDTYGEIGRDFAHVHHLKPLGDRTRPTLTKLDDLAVVCANCHAMLHRGGEHRSLTGLLDIKPRV